MPSLTVQQAVQLAIQHHQAGHLAEAERLYREILFVQPGHPEVLWLRGQLAWQTGRPDLAVLYWQQVIAAAPDNAAAHGKLGEAFSAMNQLPEAEAAFRRVLELKPGDPDAFNNLGVILARQGRTEEAAEVYHRALRIVPAHASMWNNLGIVLAESGKLKEARIAYGRSLELDPNQPEGHNNLGNVLRECGEIEASLSASRRALELNPNYADAYSNIGITLASQRRFEEATAAYRKALQLDPAHARAWNNLAITLGELGQFEEALASYRQALELDPNDADTHNNLGNLLKDCGQLDEALQSFRKSVFLNPRNASVHSNLIYAMHFHPAVDAQAISAEQDRWNRQFSDPVKSLIRPHENDRKPDRRLRIGYVSPEFRDHVTGRYLIPLFRSHDREQFEIICYTGVVRPDELTEQFRGLAHRWCETVGASDEELAERIRQDEVDILVDLTQHMSGNRLPVFARWPAPVQVSFAGYPASSGVEAIGYRISDRYLECEGETDADRQERVHCIDSFWCYDPCGAGVMVSPSPANAQNVVTFGSLNNFCKVNDRVLTLWAWVLRRVSNSRLILLAHTGSHRQRAVECLVREGVSADRVRFVEPCSRKEYLELYHRIDIALDPFPYGGHTTSLDALWMGVPVISLKGTQSVSNGGLSILSNLGRCEWVAHSIDEYVEIAVRLAQDTTRLADLRRSLRGHMENSVLMNASHFARGIEMAYRDIWQRWCSQGCNR